MSTQTARQPQPAERLFQMIMGTFVSQAVGAAVRAGLPDALGPEAKTAAELAAATGSNPDAVGRLLRALASVGVVGQDEEGRYLANEISDLLTTSHPASAAPMAVWLSEPEHRAAWSSLPHSIRTGEPAFDATHGAPCFEYFASNPAFGAVFNDAMTGFSRQMHRAAAAAYDFSGVGSLVDVGGGHGALLASILAANPHLRGTLFDLPHVTAGAPAVFEAAGVADRVSVVGGSFFDAVPAGADAYLLSVVLHDWSDERARAILENVRGAMAPGGRLLLNEQVIAPGDAPHPGKWLDLEMLVMTPGGRERTEAEWRALLESAGFELTAVVPTEALTAIIEARARA